MSAAGKTSQTAAKVIVPRRGDIWLVNFEPAVGSQIRKTRPALVLPR